jgi:hypothetical protein
MLTVTFFICPSLFIDSQSLVGDGALSNLGMVEARRLSRRSYQGRWSWAAAALYGGCRNPRVRFVFLDILGFYLQI